MTTIHLKPGTLVYKEFYNTLETKISEVCNKIGFDSSKVSWWIYDPNNDSSKNVLKRFLIGKHGKDYGYCILESNEICISTLTLQKSSQAQLHKKKQCIWNHGEPYEDTLADVLIDEITHIQTECSHGTLLYDNKYRENYLRFYNSSSAALMYK